MLSVKKKGDLTRDEEEALAIVLLPFNTQVWSAHLI